MELDGAVAVVTGSARGIGRSIAGALLRERAGVGLVDVLGDELARTAEELSEGSRGRVLPVAADVTVPSDVESMVARVEEELGPVDVLVNNAGTFSSIAPVWESDPERWFRDIRVNLYGTYLCCRAVMAGMVERGRGYVINVASSGGVSDAHPYCTSYACSKTAMVRLTEGMARETAESGVKAFVVGPPAIFTDMTRFIMEDPGGRKWRPGFGRIFEEGRGHAPELVASFVLELLTGRADRLSGRFFRIPGDLARLAAQADAILAADLLTLRIRQP